MTDAVELEVLEVLAFLRLPRCFRDYWGWLNVDTDYFVLNLLIHKLFQYLVT